MNLIKLYELFKKNTNNVSTDSRRIEAGSMFFALKGENFDGNKYADSALDKGASFAVIDNPQFKKSDRFIVVNDVLGTLQKLASYHVEQLKPGLKLIGLTGSNGKTTTKELVANVLKSHYKIQYTEGNLNNHIGVPLTLLKLKPDTEIAIVEMGANHPGEIALLSSIAKPDLGLITNIGEAHLEGFGSLKGVLDAKSELFEYLRKEKGVIFLNSNDDLLFEKYANNSESDIIYYGNREKSLVDGKILKSDVHGQNVELNFKERKYQFHTELIGKYNLDNFLAASAIGSYFKVPEKQIVESLGLYEPNLKRSQPIKTQSNHLVLDAYNANPTSMMAALQNFSEFESTGKCAVLGSMKELGKESCAFHKKIIEFLEKQNFEQVILVGNEFLETEHSFKNFKDVDGLIDWLKLNPINNKTILIKGSRANQLEKIAEYL